MKKAKKTGSALVIASGGLDSTVALHWALKKYRTVEALTFRYGQKHQRQEGAAVRAICRKAGVPLTAIDLSFVGRHFASSLLKGGAKIPEGRYAAKTMASTVVPFRNGIMLAVAAGFAESRGLGTVVLGNHAGDHFLYPDCRAPFVDAIARAIREGTMAHVRVASPFCRLTKADIVRAGVRLGAPLQLTYSCYNGGRHHCGRCGTCLERKEAFARAGVPDPTKYAVI